MDLRPVPGVNFLECVIQNKKEGDKTLKQIMKKDRYNYMTSILFSFLVVNFILKRLQT